MIIRSKNNIFDVTGFIAGLQRTARGVLLMSDKSEKAFSTAWLITDALAIIPNFSMGLPAQKAFFTETLLTEVINLYSTDGKQVKANVIAPLSAKPDSLEGVLLRLHEPQTGCALALEFETPSTDEQICLLHFPSGVREIKFSTGHIIEVVEPWLKYDADTEAGSSGAPILSAATWKLIGMHMKSSHSERMNEGLSLSAIFGGLQDSSAWREIAEHHKLANVAAARRALQQLDLNIASSERENIRALLPAAVQWSFDPKEFTPENQLRLKPMVTNASAEKGWILRPGERQRLLRSAGSLEVLRQARGGKESSSDQREQVISRILSGPPFDLEKIEEAALPYWLQAVRWFAGVVPDLPTAADVSRTLEKRRVRSRLQSVAGSDFRGRRTELSQLNSWYAESEQGPMVVTGIGGVGKSALVARFASQLNPDTLLLWLDFDRADLAPDDALSVLGLISEQMTVQLSDFDAPELEESIWEQSAENLGKELNDSLGDFKSALLVLDGFEVAQHVKQHQEIWKVLELILSKASRLRIVVSGRASVGKLKLCERDSRSIHLDGMSPEDAKAWLRENNIEDEEMLSKLIEVTEGVPLKLKLAIRFVETGGKLNELLKELPKILIEGFLYQRVLDRVIDPLLKDVARDALVLRKITSDMISEVLNERIPEGLDAKEVFSRLAQEFALVLRDESDTQVSSVITISETGTLSVRPELRSATLKLLEHDTPDRVKTIDKRAAKWYAKQNLNKPANAAELVYHRLRLKNIKGAEQVWRDDCAPFLIHAEEDLPEKAVNEREWLRKRKKGADTSSFDLKVWEKEAVQRIRDAFARGLQRIVPTILNENRERSETSPLIIYDAWSLRQNGKLEAARALIGQKDASFDLIWRDRFIIGAFLAVEADDYRKADALLASVERQEFWYESKTHQIDALAVRAARVRLNVDLDAEIQLNEFFKIYPDEFGWEVFGRYLAPSDVMLPNLSRRIDNRKFEYKQLPLEIPLSESELARFGRELSKRRKTKLSRKLDNIYSQFENVIWTDFKELFTDEDIDIPFYASLVDKVNRKLSDKRFSGSIEELVLHLASLGWRKWQLATSSLFLAQASKLLNSRESFADSLTLSVTNTLAAFQDEELLDFRKTDYILNNTLHQTQAILAPITKKRLSLIKDFIYQEGKENEVTGEIKEWFDLTEKKMLGSKDDVHISPLTDFSKVLQEKEFRVFLYLFGPDPLEMLCRRILGIPDNSNL